MSSAYIGRRGSKRCRNELEQVELGPSKARIITPIAPTFSYRTMSVIGAPSAVASGSAAAARVMTRRMVRELSVVKGFLEVMEEPAVALLEASEEMAVKVEEVKVKMEEVKVKVEDLEEEAMVAVMKEEPKENEEEEVAKEVKTTVGDAEEEAEDGPEESGVGGGTAVVTEGIVGYREEFDDGLIDWNAWSSELEEKTWWGTWYWDWIWCPHSDYIHNGINWASYSLNNEGADWEVGLWKW